MRVLGLVWSKADAKDIRQASAELLAEQRPDGGWAQLLDWKVMRTPPARRWWRYTRREH